MKPSTPFFYLLAVFTTVNAGEGVEVVPVARDNDSRLSKRAVAELTLCTSTSFSGGCTTFSSTAGSNICLSPLPNQYITDLLSAHTNPGIICTMFTGQGCTSGCEVCVDSSGWANMTSIGAVQSYRCVVADAAGCSNSACVHK